MLGFASLLFAALDVEVRGEEVEEGEGDFEFDCCDCDDEALVCLLIEESDF